MCYKLDISLRSIIVYKRNELHILYHSRSNLSVICSGNYLNCRMMKTDEVVNFMGLKVLVIATKRQKHFLRQYHIIVRSLLSLPDNK